MSTIHFSAEELANIVNVLTDRDTSKDDVASIMAEVSTVNTEAYNACYGASETSSTTSDILAHWTYIGDVGLALSTLSMLEYNCDGLMDRGLAAKIGRLGFMVARKMQSRMGDLNRRIQWHEEERKNLKAEIEALKAAQPAKAKRSRKSAA